jgi:hypothetical protein
VSPVCAQPGRTVIAAAPPHSQVGPAQAAGSLVTGVIRASGVPGSAELGKGVGERGEHGGAAWRREDDDRQVWAQLAERGRGVRDRPPSLSAPSRMWPDRMISFGSRPIVGGGALFPKYEFDYSESCDQAGSRRSFRGAECRQ